MTTNHSHSARFDPELGGRARLLDEHCGQMAATLREIRDHTDSTKTPNFTVRDVLAIRHACDTALAAYEAMLKEEA